jgi:Zn-dependent protease with chaperone function
MTQKSFEELIIRLESYARKQPSAYKIEVALLALVGYLYFVAMVAGLSIVFGLMARARLGHESSLLVEGAIFALAAAWTLWWWSRIEFHSPEGYTLIREEAPKLFAMIDGLTSQLRAPAVHHVLLTDEFNASIVQVPRFGLLGRASNYLVIGLPLMQALSPDQFKAVLAHEIAHLSGNHGRFSSWVYRVRQTWITVLENVDDPARGGGFVFWRFLRWYAPFFSAYSFVLARSNEYVADRTAADAVGARALADALIATRIKASFVQNHFWPSVFNKAICEPKPPRAPHAAMFHALPKAPFGHDAERWFEEALAERTTFADTHPSLASRLSALGFRAAPISPDTQTPPPPPLPMPEPVSTTAADQYLGRLVDHFMRHFDADWHAQIAESWRHRHEEAQEAQGILDDLKRKAKREGLSLDEMWTLFQLISEYRGDDAGIPVLEKILNGVPDDARANYALGQILLKKDDDRGVKLLKRAIAKEPDCTIPASEAAYFFLKRMGRFNEAVEFRRQADEYRDLLAQARQERLSISSRDRYVHHGLGSAHLHTLRAQLAAYPTVRKAYVVRKDCRYLPEKPFYVLGIVPKRSIFVPSKIAEHQDMAEELAAALSLPGEARLVLLVGRHMRLGRELRRMTSSLIYRS